MRKLLALIALAIATLVGAPAFAADIPEYPDIEIPEVDYDLGDSFYLRGSAALNVHWAREVRHPDACACETTFTPDSLGYGYSWGVGFGYETGTGLRFDGTIDVLETQGLGITKVGGPNPGKYTLMLRSTIALANVYYDFSFGDMGGYGGQGGAFGYVGVGAGVSYNQVQAN